MATWSEAPAFFWTSKRLGCAKCHTIDGTGSKAGPDLFSAGDQFTRGELIDAVLHPSATIAVGYSTTVVETKSGEQYEGVLKQATEAGVELIGGYGQRRWIAKGEIRQQQGSAVSLMPEPWRFSFDSITGDLWVADLGQERGDEVGIVRRCENHGWNVYEGFELFSNQHRRSDQRYVAPIFSTRRKQGSAMVGGCVYRGDRELSFYGVYIFGDDTSKRIWALKHQNRTLTAVRQIATCPQPITCFSTDANGDIYVVGYEGMIYQLDLTAAKFDV